MMKKLVLCVCVWKRGDLVAFADHGTLHDLSMYIFKWLASNKIKSIIMKYDYCAQLKKKVLNLYTVLQHVVLKQI